ncbi:MAG: hypothetical protein LAO08_10775 [Acidobacteriia bacterium]|nr:hypothetical protein [Terriglobia bacterium]
MRRLCTFCISFLMGAALVAILPLSACAQEQFQFESDLMAKRRVFDSVGAGFRAIRRGPNGNYYVLTAPAPAVLIFDPAGKRMGQIPSESAAAAKGAALVYGESFDVDREGRVAVADRGANAVKIYAPNGSLAATISVPAPVSIVFLTGGEVAVTRAGGERLVTVYDLAGNVVRDFGDREEIADQVDINNQVNFGHLAADDAGNTYFAFDYLPEPTVRKFDHAGYLSMAISLMTLEFQPAAQAARKAIARSETGIPSLHRIISAVGVDPQTQDVWLAIGTLLMHFDKEGQRIASFRTFTPGGARLEPSMILVEPDRLLIGADPQGTYEFPKPAKLPQ